MKSADQSGQARQEAESLGAPPEAGCGSSRRDFICAAGVAGAAVVLGSRHSVRAQEPGDEWIDPSAGWEWVDPEEMYDPEYEYRYVSDDLDPEGWEWVDPNEQYDPTYEYVFIEMYEDGSIAEWVMADPEEPFDPEYEYANIDDTPIFWEDLDGIEVEDPNYHYGYEYDYVYPDGTPSQWEWIQPGEPFDGTYEYVYAEEV